MKNFLFLCCFSATILGINSCATNPVTGKSQMVLMSEEQEIQMGKEADPQIIQQFGLYNDQALQTYIDQLGQQLVKVSHRPNIEYHFRVLNSDVVNAFAVPGGYVYFTRGIMGYLNDEAEFAGVLGHEIGHITARHTVAQQRNAMLGQIGILAGMVLSPTIAQFGEALSQGYSLLLLKYGRDAERQSDDLGVEYSSKLGYDAQRMADFFQVLEKMGEDSGQELPTFLSTHPNPGDRYNTVKKKAAEMKQQLNITNPKVNRDTYLRKIDGILFGEDPKEGFMQNGVFYHPDLRFQFTPPSNWNYANSPTQVQFASPDGRALMILTTGQGNSLQEAANAFVQQYQMQVVGSQQTTINGMPALQVQANLQQQQGVLSTLSYFIQYNNAIYHIMGVTAAADMNSYGNVFVNSANSFRQLTDQAIINKKPERIRIKTVNSAMTLQQALSNNGVPSARMHEHSLVNGMELNTPLAAGTLIKVISQ
ncbi:MAG: M48 family metalloprotease [Flavisolibacter sp.]